MSVKQTIGETAMEAALRSAGVVRPNAEPSQQTAVPAAPAVPEVSHTPTPANTQANHKGFKMDNTAIPSAFNLNNLMARPMDRAPVGEQLTALRAAFQELAKTGIKEQEFLNALHLDIIADTAVPVIAVSMSLTANNTPYTAVYELLIEDALDGTIQDRQTSDNLGPITLRRTVADAADTAMWNSVSSVIARRVKSQVIFAGSMVLPKGTEVNPKSSVLRQTLFTAVQAVYTVLQEATGGESFVYAVKNLTDRASLAVNVDYASQDNLSAVGLPVRNDLNVTLRAMGTESNNDSVVNRRTAPLTSVDCFVDFVWNPQRQQQMGPYVTNVPSTREFNPRIVMTRVDSRLSAITLPQQLLAIATAYTLTSGWSWLGAYLPRFASRAMRNAGASGRGAGEIELRDLGALGLEIDLDGKGKRRHSLFSTKTSDEDLRSLASATINPEAIFTLKIEEVGELTWVQEAFAQAAAGNTKAIKAIVDAADELTSGEFGKRWNQIQAPKAICVDDRIRVHTGYYENRADGQRYSLDTIDTLAMLNICGDKDMDKVRRFQATFDQRDVSIQRRQADRLAILEDVLGAGNIVLTGSANYYSLTTVFGQILVDSIVAAGADIRPSNMVMDFSGMAGRQAYDLSQVAMAPGMVAGLTQGNRTGGTGHFNSGVQSRY